LVSKLSEFGARLTMGPGDMIVQLYYQCPGVRTGLGHTIFQVLSMVLNRKCAVPGVPSVIRVREGGEYRSRVL
jgi:hypothetical protein